MISNGKKDVEPDDKSVKLLVRRKREGSEESTQDVQIKRSKGDNAKDNSSNNTIEWRTMESEDVVGNFRREVEMMQDEYNENNAPENENASRV